jgi:hypothetical protein
VHSAPPAVAQQVPDSQLAPITHSDPAQHASPGTPQLGVDGASGRAASISTEVPVSIVIPPSESAPPLAHPKTAKEKKSPKKRRMAPT